MDDGVELADVIGQLRHELSRAMWAGEHADLRFEADTVELELTVAVEKGTGVDAKARFWVLDAGASATRSSAVTQRIMLRLRPFQADAPQRPAAIAGRALPHER